MNNTKIFVFIAGILISIGSMGQKVKKCYMLLEENKPKQALSCFQKQEDSSSAEVLFGLAESLLATKENPEQLHLAYLFVDSAEAAYDSLELKQKLKLKDKWDIGKGKFSKTRNRAAFFAYDFVSDSSITQLKKFTEQYAGTPTITDANARIEELELFANLPKDKPIDYYSSIIEKYPDNEKINDIWQIFYHNYTFDGELLTIEKFTINFPQYPYPDEIDRDRNTAKMAERHKLDEKYIPSLNHLYGAYMKLAAPRHRALKVLRTYISPFLESKQFSRAADTVSNYSEYFAGNGDFEKLLETLTRKEAAPEKKPLPGLVNSKGYEFSPVLTKNDKLMYFCGKDRPECIGGEDILESEYRDSMWQQPTIIPGINTVLGNEAPESLSPDGSRMLVFQNGDIYYSDKYRDNKDRLRWSDPIRYKAVNSPGWEGDACLTADGNAILFASESGERLNPQFIAKERKDRFDIFVSLRDNGSWAEPLNLGPVVNSHDCDRYPYLHPDMKTLYFCSEGHGSLGGLDVFVTTRLNDSSWTEWSEPINLGRYINTIYDDTGYKISNDGAQAFYAAFGGAKFDIYTVTIPEDKRPQKLAVVSGRIIGIDSLGIQADITVEDLATKKIIGIFRSDVQDGSYTMLLPLGKNYGYYVSKKGFFPESGNVDLSQETEMVELASNFSLHSIDTLVKHQGKVTVNNIFFDNDAYSIKPSSYLELDRIAHIINENNIKKVQFEGHTDSVGTDTYNMELSQKRAEAVAAYVQKLTPGCTITAKAFGSKQPVADNKSAQGRKLNRRVELRFGTNSK